MAYISVLWARRNEGEMENNLLRQLSIAMGLDPSIVQIQTWDFRKLQLTSPKPLRRHPALLAKWVCD